MALAALGALYSLYFAITTKQDKPLPPNRHLDSLPLNPHITMFGILAAAAFTAACINLGMLLGSSKSGEQSLLDRSLILICFIGCGISVAILMWAFVYYGRPQSTVEAALRIANAARTAAHEACKETTEALLLARNAMDKLDSLKQTITDENKEWEIIPESDIDLTPLNDAIESINNRLSTMDKNNNNKDIPQSLLNRLAALESLISSTSTHPPSEIDFTSLNDAIESINNRLSTMDTEENNNNNKDILQPLLDRLTALESLISSNSTYPPSSDLNAIVLTDTRNRLSTLETTLSARATRRTHLVKELKTYVSHNFAAQNYLSRRIGNLADNGDTIDDHVTAILQAVAWELQAKTRELDALRAGGAVHPPNGRWNLPAPTGQGGSFGGRGF